MTTRSVRWPVPASAFLVIAATSAGAQPTTTSALATTFADGRVTTNPILKTFGGYWTPLFPRIHGVATDRDGLPLNALETVWRLEGENLVLRVSLFYGKVNQRRIEVATVRLVGEERKQVGELRAFGVEPVTYSLVHVSSNAMSLPLTRSASGQLHLRVEPLGVDVPAYSVSLENLSTTRTVIAVEYKAFREDRVTISGRRTMPRNQPLIAPGGVDTWRVTIGGSGDSDWQPYDRFEVTGVKWDDGVVEGDTAFAEHERELNGERMRQIDRVLSLLQSMANRPLREVHAAVEQLPTASIGEKQVADAARDDIDHFLSRLDPVRTSSWRQDLVTSYEAWKRRIAKGW